MFHQVYIKDTEKQRLGLREMALISVSCENNWKICTIFYKEINIAHLGHWLPSVSRYLSHGFVLLFIRVTCHTVLFCPSDSFPPTPTLLPKGEAPSLFRNPFQFDWPVRDLADSCISNSVNNLMQIIHKSVSLLAMSFRSCLLDVAILISFRHLTLNMSEHRMYPPH